MASFKVFIIHWKWLNVRSNGLLHDDRVPQLLGSQITESVVKLGDIWHFTKRKSNSSIGCRLYKESLICYHMNPIVGSELGLFQSRCDCWLFHVAQRESFPLRFYNKPRMQHRLLSYKNPNWNLTKINHF